MMKNLLSLIAIAVLTLASCSKEDPIPEEERLNVSVTTWFETHSPLVAESFPITLTIKCDAAPVVTFELADADALALISPSSIPTPQSN